MTKKIQISQVSLNLDHKKALSAFLKGGLMQNLVDLHTHSVLSKHAFSSVTENIAYAKRNGLKYYGISEHQEDEYGVGSHKYAALNLHTIPRNVDGVHILRGIELNILDDGYIEMPLALYEYVDYSIISLHTYVYSPKHTKEENTNAFLKAMDFPKVKILGHIDNPAYPLDYEKVIEEAHKRNLIIEFNNNSLAPNGARVGAKEKDYEILEICRRLNCPIIISSDAHICYDVGRYDRAYDFLKEIDFPMDLVLNFNESLFLKYFKEFVE